MEQHREKIEHYSVMMENMGLTPVAARVFVYLLLSPDNQVTFEELVEYYKVSKSAVSNAIKMLSVSNMITGKTVGGKRKRYFSIDFKNLFNEDQISGKFKLFYNMLDDIRLTRGENDAFSKEIENVSVLYKMLLVELPIIIERWKRTIELDNKS